MYKILIVLGIFFLSFNLFSLEKKKLDSRLVKIENLAKEKKYYTAMSQLMALDPQKTDPVVQIYRVDFTIKYFVTSINHKMFSFKNLKPNQNIYDVRGKTGQSNIILYDPEKVLKDLIKNHPSNYNLKISLGLYYSDVHSRYRKRWLLPAKELRRLTQTLILDAYNHKVYSQRSLSVLGQSFLYSQKYKEGIKYLKILLLKDKKNPRIHYNIAFGYFRMGNGEKCIEHATIAFDNYKKNYYKADAAGILGFCFKVKKDYKKSYNYFKAATELAPKDPRHGMNLIDAAIMLEDDTLIQKTALQYIMIKPERPYLYVKMLRNLAKQKKVSHGILMLENNLSKIKNDAVKANFHYFIGVSYVSFMPDKNKARDNLKKSEKLYKTFLKSDHKIFAVLKKYYEYIDKMK